MKGDRMTYQDLLKALSELTPDQLACDVIAEFGPEDECHPAELRICADNHFEMPDNYPVIFVP